MVMAVFYISARIAFFSSLDASSGQSRRRSQATAPFRRPRFIFFYSGRGWSEILPKNAPNSSCSTQISRIIDICDDFRFGNSEQGDDLLPGHMFFGHKLKITHICNVFRIIRLGLE